MFLRVFAQGMVGREIEQEPFAECVGVLVAAPLVAIVAILHDELYRKRFLPGVTDADLDRLARNALHERPSAAK